jgi:hypothetical protein
MIFLSYPAHLDPDGGAQCGLPAEIGRPFRAHPHASNTAGRGPSTWHDSLEHDHHGRGDFGGRPVWDRAARPEWVIRRSNAAPANHLGRPASLWIKALRPSRPRGQFVGSASGHPDGNGRAEGGTAR